MQIREIAPSDIDPCAQLFVMTFSNPPWNENWPAEVARKRLADCAASPGFLGLLAGDADGVHGFAFGNVQHYGTERHYYLLELCVRTDRQREGIGGRLLTALRERMEADGIARIYTLTARDTPAQEFYLKQGYYTSPRMVMMARRLP